MIDRAEEHVANIRATLLGWNIHEMHFAEKPNFILIGLFDEFISTAEPTPLTYSREEYGLTIIYRLRKGLAPSEIYGPLEDATPSIAAMHKAMHIAAGWVVTYGPNEQALRAHITQCLAPLLHCSDRN